MLWHLCEYLQKVIYSQKYVVNKVYYLLNSSLFIYLVITGTWQFYLNVYIDLPHKKNDSTSRIICRFTIKLYFTIFTIYLEYKTTTYVSSVNQIIRTFK